MKTEIMPDTKSVFPRGANATHMPFFDGSTLVFSQGASPIEREFTCQGSIWKNLRHNPALAERFRNLPRTQKIRYRAWKLAYCEMEDKIVRSIITGLPANGIECSPSFYKEKDRVHLSFIGGTDSKAGIGYKLYTSSGPNLGQLEPVKPLFDQAIFFGFVSPHHVCWGAGNKINLKEKASGNIIHFVTDFNRIVRTSFLAEEPAKLLITGIGHERNYQTIIYNLSDGNISQVTIDDAVAVYKSTLHQNRLIAARKVGEGFEDRELFESEYTLSPSAIKMSKED